ncbi:MAG: SRPBCC family protein [Candidatus Promineifilaceae bacterium]
MAKVTKSVTIKGDVGRLYALWADFENFPHFMKYISSVKKTGPTTSHWVMEGPLGLRLDWNAEMTRREENKRIAWSSKDANGTVTTSGQVLFNELPESNETEVTVSMQYSPPGGKAGEVFANLFGKPEQRVQEDLRNFKSYAEGMAQRSTVRNK